MGGRSLGVLGASVLGIGLLVGSFYGPAIAGRQFNYRDSAHYYYPLYQRVEADWNAGRVPLWEPEENGGMPLLGNPTAAVLYPGKLVYRILPYPLAARAYILLHMAIALAGMIALARSLGIGGVGSVLAGIGYAFGVPVSFQYCNVIFLVGAAWLPWAFRAIDAWVRRGNVRGIAGLAIVLALQVLGGDPQAAYLEGLSAGAYAIVLARRGNADRPRPSTRRRVATAILLATALLAWVGVTLALAAYLPEIRKKGTPTPSFPWNRHLPAAVLGAWGLAGLGLLRRWRIDRSRGRDTGITRVMPRFAGLAGAAVLAGLLAGAQLLPVMEFTGQTSRASDEGTHDPYPFSLEPYRIFEFAFPNAFGTTDRGNRSWLLSIPPMTSHRIWVPSLYLGGTTFVLALVGFGFRGEPRWRGWVAGIALASLLGSFGEFASPLWIGRFFAPIAAVVGPHDPPETNAIRLDGRLRDGDGGIYSVVTSLIPGFGQFRYPSKLLTLTSAALALLAGLGWDRVASGEGRRRAIRIASGIAATGLVAWAGVSLGRERIVSAWTENSWSSIFGPFDPAGAHADLARGLAQGAIVATGLLATIRLARRSPAAAGMIVIALTALDLAWSNARWIATADQAEFDRVPRAAELIAEAERDQPSSGPFRVHRSPIWSPSVWRQQNPTDRSLDFLRWERDTIQPKYGINHGIHFTHTLGVAELFDYEWFFAPFHTFLDPAVARSIRHANPAEPIIYQLRRGFDLWGTRYFVLPGLTRWTDPERGIASLLDNAVPLYPKPGAFQGPGGAERREAWSLGEDVQILRNRSAYPRSWIVHQAQFSDPVEGLGRAERKGPMEQMLYLADPFWNSPNRTVYDLRSLAWVEVADRSGVNRFLAGGPTGSGETVDVTYPSPNRVELDANLERPGLVILADTFYPGWTLTIDGQPAPILRANRMMRGAAVESGRHRLVYEYRPRSFLVGGGFSLVGVVGWVGLLAANRRRRAPSPDAPAAG